MLNQINGNRIVIQGYWDGEPIWRFKSSAEILAEELEKQKKVYPIKLDINQNGIK